MRSNLASHLTRPSPFSLFLPLPIAERKSALSASTESTPVLVEPGPSRCKGVRNLSCRSSIAASSFIIASSSGAVSSSFAVSSSITTSISFFIAVSFSIAVFCFIAASSSIAVSSSSAVSCYFTVSSSVAVSFLIAVSCTSPITSSITFSSVAVSSPPLLPITAFPSIAASSFNAASSSFRCLFF
jgi:hypothetical protein